MSFEDPLCGGGRRLQAHSLGTWLKFIAILFKGEDLPTAEDIQGAGSMTTPVTVCTALELKRQSARCAAEIQARQPSVGACHDSQAYLPDGAELPEDVVHLLRRDVEGQVSHVQDPTEHQPLSGAQPRASPQQPPQPSRGVGPNLFTSGGNRAFLARMAILPRGAAGQRLPQAGGGAWPPALAGRLSGCHWGGRGPPAGRAGRPGVAAGEWGTRWHSARAPGTAFGRSSAEQKKKGNQENRDFCPSAWNRSLFLLGSSMFSTHVTMYHHLISQAGWNRCNLSIYLTSSTSSHSERPAQG